MNKLFVFTLCLLLTLSLFSACTHQQENTPDITTDEQTDEAFHPSPATDFKYSEDADGTILITYIGADETVVIPSQIDGKTVSAIAAYGFSDNTHVAHIVLPEGIKGINVGAFARCSSLETIYIPNSVEYIDKLAFTDCISLIHMTLGNGITLIGEYAFANCTALTSIDLPQSLRVIDYGALQNTGLTEITIPEGITRIDMGVFYECKNLKTVYIPADIPALSSGVFAYCSALEDIHFAGTIEQWQNLQKAEDWDSDTNHYTIHCADDIIKSTQN